jgi:general secretion pathway protein F
MARYLYSALQPDGSVARGHIDAANASLVVQRLEAVNQHAIEVRLAEPSAGWLERLSPIKPSRGDEVTLFTRELQWLLRAGATLSRALEIAATTHPGPFARVIGELRNELRSGSAFSAALGKYPELFPASYVSMVALAEASGTLPSVLARIADTRAKQRTLRRKILSALLYPSVLITVAILSLGVVFTLVLPRLHSLFAGSGGRPGSSLSILLAISDFLVAYGQPLLLGFALAGAALFAALNRPSIRAQLHELLSRIPLVGPLMQLSFSAEFCRSLSLLTRAGMGLPQSFDLLLDLSGTPRIRAALARTAAALRRGEDYIGVLQDSAVFPVLVPAMFRVASETGDVAPALDQLADRFDEDFDIATTRFLGLLEPCIVVGLSVLVGFIVVTVMNGLISINDIAG